MITRDVADEVIAASDKLVKNANFGIMVMKNAAYYFAIMIAVQTGQIGLAKEIATANMDIDDIASNGFLFWSPRKTLTRLKRFSLKLQEIMPGRKNVGMIHLQDYM